MIANLLEGIEVQLNTDYLKDKEKLDAVIASVLDKADKELA